MCPRFPKTKKRRKGVSGTQQLIAKIARREKIAPAAPRKTTAAAACLDHAYEHLGFSSAWALATFLDSLAARSPSPVQRVKLPKWKTPRGVRATGVRCRCGGRDFACGLCGGHAWGVVVKTSIKKAAAS